MNKTSTIFLTGGGGFIGKHFRAIASNEGYRVYVLSRKKLELYKNEILIQGSFGDIKSLDFPDKEIDFVVNLAGEKRNERLMQAINVDAVAELMDFASSLKKAKYIHMGSAGIYGIAQHPDIIITEKSTVYPSNNYEKTKNEADEFIIKKASENKLDFVILRPTNVFGTDEPAMKLLNLMRAVKNGRFFMIDPNAMVNYIGVKSVCKSIIDTFKFSEPASVFNINAPCSIYEFSKLISEVTQKENKTIKTIPPTLKFAFKFACKMGDFLPAKYQKINSAKYRELTDHTYIDSNAFFNQSSRNPFAELKDELVELAKWYQKRNLL